MIRLSKGQLVVLGMMLATILIQLWRIKLYE